MREEELSVVFPFWDKLKKNQKELLCGSVRHASVPKGTRYVSSEGENGCFYIRRGTFSALLMGETDTETALFRIRKDNFCVLDLFAVCGREISDVAFQALTLCDVYFVERGAFLVLLKSCQGFVEKVYQGLLSVFPDLISAIGQRDYYSLDRRVASVLLAESNRQRSNTVLITHERIASQIGSAREVVTRKLHEFSEMGIVRCQRGKIILLNKDKLKKNKFSTDEQN